MQTREAVARRALALSLIALRSRYEIAMAKTWWRKSKFRKLGHELHEWASEQELDGFLSPKERMLHERQFGTWSVEEARERFWRLESLKAVLWCTRALDEMPSYFKVGAADDTYAKLLVGKNVADFLAQAKLRDEPEITKEREFALFLNWRCRTEALRLLGMRPPVGDSYRNVVIRALPAITECGFPIEHDGVDILVNRVRFIDVGKAKANIMSICYERHLALEWVLGEADWDEARADT
jgi:Domain of unknown function (DUF4272)